MTHPTPPAQASTLSQQVADAQADMATWTPEQRAGVRLEGGGAQASDEQAAITKQLTIWRAEVARLNNLIAHASGVQASDEPMRAAFEAHVRRMDPKRLIIHRFEDGEYMHLGIEQQWQGWQAALATPRATADVDRVRDLIAEHVANNWPMRKYSLEEIEIKLGESDISGIATKGAKP